jgi:hypothetical protein
VAPFSLLPLAILAPLLLVSFLRTRTIPLPANFKPLFFFLLFALATSLVALLDPPLALRGATLLDRMVRGWVSLLLGLGFFFTAFWMNRSAQDLRYSLKRIYWGLGLTIFWSLIQAVAINTPLIPRQFINHIQLLFSTRALLPRRISGFAYEPAWLADQIVIFYLPWLISSLVTFRPLSRNKWLEPLLLVGSLIVLVFTFSRGGLLTAAVGLVLVFIIFGRNLFEKLFQWSALPFRMGKQGVSDAVLRISLLLLLVLSLFAAVSFLLTYGYFARVLEVAEADSLVDYVVDIGGGPRLAYALAGYEIFVHRPITGIGLGASGLELLQSIPDWSSNLPEVARQLSPDSNLIPNIKNLYVRLLAETGLPGFWAFLVFSLSFLTIIRNLALSRDRGLSFVAVAGLFAWAAIMVRNFTQDSFTFPVMWIILGMLVGQSPSILVKLRTERKLWTKGRS